MMGRPAALTAEMYDRFDTAEAMRDLAELTRHDRYQASAGILAAAEYVAERAEAAGLSDVEIIRFPADGARHWWTFAAPLSWTPLGAEVLLDPVDGQAAHRLVSYPADPYRLALQSAPTPAGGVTVRLVPLSRLDPGEARGALVVLDTPAPPTTVLPRLAAAGAAGVLVGPATDGDGPAGRLELPNGSALIGISLTAQDMRVALRSARHGGTARITVAVSGGAPMPVVTARLPGHGDEEALLCAHLCHPRPSANDNASGVATALGVARALAGRERRLPGRRGLRFVWGPEIVGLAAYLGDRVASGVAPRPFAAVNLDMVGEDQRRCGGPLIVERAPDSMPGVLSAVVENCVELLPPQGRSYSGAVGCDTWAWRATPFVGASDQLLLSDPATGCPAVQLGHWPDRFHHTSDDTMDKVDPAELRRTGAVAAAALTAVRDTGADEAAELESVVTRWGVRQLHDCCTGLPHAPAADAAGGKDVFDPASPQHRGELLRHRLAVVSRSLAAVSALDGGQGEERRAVRTTWLGALTAHLEELLTAQAAPRPQHPSTLLPRWAGPFNLRALGESARPEDQRWMASWPAAGGGSGYATLLALALALDGVTDREGVLRRAAMASGLPIPRDAAHRFFDALVGAGWAVETGS